MEFKCYSQHEIIIKMKNGDVYQGPIENSQNNKDDLSIEKVVSYLGNDIVEEIQKTGFEEIEDLKVVKHYKLKPIQDSNKERHESDEEDEEEKEDRPGKTPKRKLRPKISREDYFSILTLQRCYRVVNQMNISFHTAIADLGMSEKVALCGKSPNLGRNEKLTVIAFATKCHTYIFDLEKLGDDAFRMGIKTLLESESIVKVVHDCRLLSDCLFHMHNITLANVRDLEAEDAVVSSNVIEGLVIRRRTLKQLVRSYLGLTGRSVPEHRTISWTDVSNDVTLQTHLANYVSYLIPIQKSIEMKHIRKMTDASKIYTDILRQMKNSDERLRDYNCATLTELALLLLPCRKYLVITPGRADNQAENP